LFCSTDFGALAKKKQYGQRTPIREIIHEREGQKHPKYPKEETMPININQPTKAKGKGHEKATGCNGQSDQGWRHRKQTQLQHASAQLLVSLSP